MTPQLPPPDSRLVDKVAIIKLEPNKQVRRGNGSHGVAPSHDACPDVELESADVEISRLAKLAPLEYERQRKEAAERLDIRASILDRLVAAERSKSSIDGKQGRALSLPEPKPWPRGWRDGMTARPRKADYAWTTLARVLSFAKGRGLIA